MNSIETALNTALTTAKTLSSGSFSYHNGTTAFTASVFKSFIRENNKEMQDAGYLESLDNLYVLAKTSDVSGWGLQPMTSKVYLDGESYLVGRTITKSNAYWQVYLRFIV